MSSETSIQDLGKTINDEDARLVDSILNDINSGNSRNLSSGKPGNGPNPQLNQQQMQQMQQKQMQQQMQQQQMQQQMQQQQMQQQQMQQQMAQKNLMSQQNQMQNETNLLKKNINGKKELDISEYFKNEYKTMILLVFLAIFFNIDQVNSVFNIYDGFLNENGTHNMMVYFIKGLIISAIYFMTKVYVF